MKGWAISTVIGLFETVFAEDDQMILCFKRTMVHIFQIDGSTTNWNRYKTLTVAASPS